MGVRSEDINDRRRGQSNDKDEQVDWKSIVGFKPSGSRVEEECFDYGALILINILRHWKKDLPVRVEPPTQRTR